MADLVDRQQSDIVLSDDFCGLVQRQPLRVDFVINHKLPLLFFCKNDDFCVIPRNDVTYNVDNYIFLYYM